ncbi:hypothetical protein ACFSL6_23135 [Paenibacillus thailandensis]|uniref:DUF3221 domain-containing protein n=1 Tax=Paenibacillus thailandensis TaxID=393250 RepID=A0ABW5QYK2_9BACL
MKKLMIILLMVVISACSGGNNSAYIEDQSSVTEQTQTQSSFPYPLVVWNNQKYKMTTEVIDAADKEIGKIVSHSTDEPTETPDNYSNYYKSGTKLWSIKQVDIKEAIAVETEPGKYVKAVSEKQ